MTLVAKPFPIPAPQEINFGRVEGMIREKIAAGAIPSAAVAIGRRGQIVYERAFGWADKEQKVVAKSTTPYPLASATKPMVATAVMLLAEQGKLDLDAPAGQYVPDWPVAQNPLRLEQTYTVRQLLNHTSGLGTYASIAWRNETASPRPLKETFARYGFAVHLPGTVSEYSNLGYGLLGQIVAKQSGRSLGEFLTAEIFRPLGMRDSFLVDSFVPPAEAVKKYDATGNLLPETHNDTAGAGNVYASVHDLALFGLFHVARDGDGARALLPSKTKELMRSFIDPRARYPYYKSSSYGLGWYFRKSDHGTSIVWHEGGMPGASAMLILLPEAETVAAVLINATDKNTEAQELANELLHLAVPSHRPVSFNAAEDFSPFTDQAQFVGRWEGEVHLDGRAVPCALEFAPGKNVQLEFPGQAGSAILPDKISFGALINGDLLVATVAGTLPARDVGQQPGGYILLRLLRRDRQLAGTFIAYASPEGLRHLYPFAVSLRKVSP